MANTTASHLSSIVAVGLLVTVLVGCKSSDRVVVDSATGANWVRCSLGQSYVMESTDDTPTQFGGATEAWKDYLCANEDTGALWWDRLDVQVRKYHASYLCDTSAVAYTTTSRSVSVTDTATCSSGGASHMWVMGIHGSSRPGSSIVHEVSTTPEVFTS